MRCCAALCLLVSLVLSSCSTFSGGRSGFGYSPVMPPYNRKPEWQNYSEDIMLYRYTQDSPGFSITALKIDLSFSRRMIVVSRGLTPLGPDTGRYNFRSTTVRSFMRKEKLVAAINATPFEPYRFFTGLGQSAVGVVKSGGVLYSLNNKYDAICFSEKGDIRMDSPPYKFISESDNAAGGFFIILSDGKNVSAKSPPEARSLAGSDNKGNVLFLAVIDGGGAAGKNGATFYEAAEWMKYLGAYDALCLDGGGSSVMAARKNTEDRIRVLNHPEGGVLFFFKRLSPVFIGIR